MVESFFVWLRKKWLKAELDMLIRRMANGDNLTHDDFQRATYLAELEDRQSI